MKSILGLMLCLVLACANAQFGVPLGTPYNGLATPFYFNNAQVTSYTVLANGSSTVVTSTGLYGNDPANSRYAFDLGSGAKQFVFWNATYETVYVPQLNATLCFVVNWTYSQEKIAKSQAIKVSSLLGIIDQYFGYVYDAPALPVRIGINTFQNAITNTPASIQFTSNTGGHPVNGMCVTPGTVSTAVINFPGPIYPSAPESFYQLPQSCARPIPYSSEVCYTCT